MRGSEHTAEARAAPLHHTQRVEKKTLLPWLLNSFKTDTEFKKNLIQLEIELHLETC